jgi:hypothetical protein
MNPNKHEVANGDTRGGDGEFARKKLGLIST